MHSGAVTTPVCIAPCHHGSICQNCSESMSGCATNLLKIPQLILDSGAVSTTVMISPDHHPSIRQNGSKGIACATNLLNIPQLILDSEAVTTMVWIAPRHNPVSSNAPQSKCMPCRCYLWLLCNSCKTVSILKPRKDRSKPQGVGWMQKVSVRRCKPQETLPQRLLRSDFQVSNGASLWDCDSFTPSTWQGDRKVHGSVHGRLAR